MDIHDYEDVSSSFYVLFQREQNTVVDDVTLVPPFYPQTTSSLFKPSHSFLPPNGVHDVLPTSPTLVNRTSSIQPTSLREIHSVFAMSNVVVEVPTPIPSAIVSSTSKVDNVATVVHESSPILHIGGLEKSTRTTKEPSRQKVILSKTEVDKVISDLTDTGSRMKEDLVSDSIIATELPSKESEAKSTIRVKTRKVLSRKKDIKRFKPRRVVSFRHKEQAARNYPFVPGYSDQDVLDLVFCSSVESNSKRIPYQVRNQLLMFDLFQRHFRFKAILFTHSPKITELATKLNITVIRDYQKNPFNLPYVRDLYLQSFHTYRSQFYGYINSDIIISPSIFSLIRQVTKKMESKQIPQVVEIAGRVYDSRCFILMNNHDLMTFKEYMKKCFRRITQLRNQDSADYFVFSKYFDFRSIKDVVIGRVKIDNYLISMMEKHKGYLIDSTNRVPALHLGLEGYLDKQRAKKFLYDDIHWNMEYCSNIYLVKGSLVYAKWKPLVPIDL